MLETQQKAPLKVCKIYNLMW